MAELLTYHGDMRKRCQDKFFGTILQLPNVNNALPFSVGILR